MGTKTSYFPFDGFNELQKNLAPNVYNTLEQDFNVPYVARKLIRKQR